jgi:hypothetical protein
MTELLDTTGERSLANLNANGRPLILNLGPTPGREVSGLRAEIESTAVSDNPNWQALVSALARA